MEILTHEILKFCHTGENLLPLLVIRYSCHTHYNYSSFPAIIVCNTNVSDKPLSNPHMASHGNYFPGTKKHSYF